MFELREDDEFLGRRRFGLTWMARSSVYWPIVKVVCKCRIIGRHEFKKKKKLFLDILSFWSLNFKQGIGFLRDKTYRARNWLSIYQARNKTWYILKYDIWHWISTSNSTLSSLVCVCGLCTENFALWMLYLTLSRGMSLMVSMDLSILFVKWFLI